MKRLNLSTTFLIEDSSRYQFVYASQLSGVLFSVYACMHLDAAKQHIISIEFIMVNHTTPGDNTKIGFLAGGTVAHDNILHRMPDRDNTDLSFANEIEPAIRGRNTHFNLPFEKNSELNYTVYKPQNAIPIQDIEGENFKFTRVLKGFPKEDPGMDCDQHQKLVGITCIESNIFMIR